MGKEPESNYQGVDLLCWDRPVGGVLLSHLCAWETKCGVKLVQSRLADQLFGCLDSVSVIA